MAGRKNVNDAEIIMPVERSAGAVIFYQGKKGREYLLLHHPEGPHPVGRKGYWSFPKGHIEKGEKSPDTAVREVREESGLAKIKIISGFKETERYVYVLKGKKILKFVVWFVAGSKTKRVRISFEHDDFVWLPYKEAYKKNVYRGTKEILKKADRFLSRRLAIEKS